MQGHLQQACPAFLVIPRSSSINIPIQSCQLFHLHLQAVHTFQRTACKSLCRLATSIQAPAPLPPPPTTPPAPQHSNAITLRIRRRNRSPTSLDGGRQRCLMLLLGSKHHHALLAGVLDLIETRAAAECSRSRITLVRSNTGCSPSQSVLLLQLQCAG